LPAVEHSAAQRFREVDGVAWIADSGATSAKVHKHYIKEGPVWVAENEAAEVVGFLTAERIEEDLHIWEISVRLDHQGQGIGRRLIEAASAYAGDAGLAALTLTTFRDLPWNAPFYTKLGFETLKPDEMDRRLARILEKEATGIPGGPRCAMRKPVPRRTKTQAAHGAVSFDGLGRAIGAAHVNDGQAHTPVAGARK
jgi:GNAT superfamily N-acetyltransferase